MSTTTKKATKAKKRVTKSKGAMKAMSEAKVNKPADVLKRCINAHNYLSNQLVWNKDAKTKPSANLRKSAKEALGLATIVLSYKKAKSSKIAQRTERLANTILNA